MRQLEVNQLRARVTEGRSFGLLCPWNSLIPIEAGKRIPGKIHPGVRLTGIGWTFSFSVLRWM